MVVWSPRALPQGQAETLLLLRDCTARQDKQSEPHAHATLQSVPLAQNIAASLVHLLQHRHAAAELNGDLLMRWRAPELSCEPACDRLELG